MARLCVLSAPERGCAFAFKVALRRHLAPLYCQANNALKPITALYNRVTEFFYLLMAVLEAENNDPWY
jgi:hypothetical protein